MVTTPADVDWLYQLIPPSPMVAHALQIAMKELREKRIPFTIRRYLPDGR